MAEHRNLTGTSLHETKGASTASANTVHIADGSGATSFAKITTSNIDVSSLFNVNKHKLTAFIADVSTADFVLIPITNACTLVSASCIIQNAITTADSTLTFTNSNGPVTIGTLTITYTGSAEGTTFAFTPSSNNSLAAGTYLKIATDGASSTASKMTILLNFTQTG